MTVTVQWLDVLIIVSEELSTLASVMGLSILASVMELSTLASAIACASQ